MALKDLLKKKDDIQGNGNTSTVGSQNTLGSTTPAPQIKFVRVTTAEQEVIEPPSFADEKSPTPRANGHEGLTPEKKRRSLLSRRRDHHTEEQVESHGFSEPGLQRSLSKRLSSLRLRSSSRSSVNSVHLPADLPPAPEPVTAPLTPSHTVTRDPIAESAWETRATVLGLAQPTDAIPLSPPSTASLTSPTPRAVETQLQEAIRLHESGDLETSTALFGRLASPEGANHTLSQVLYGLALRHGWGIAPDPAAALKYLSLAAASSASIEASALSSSRGKSGGDAKGELTLAIFELANCYRHAWGVTKDAVAARTYYETAANLGDVDALEEAAWCYSEGFGGKKDKGKAARYLRRAEELGRRSVGNSWIWKSKYDPGFAGD